MNINNLIAVVLTTVFSSIFTASAHDSHTHTAPWEACEEKKNWNNALLLMATTIYLKRHVNYLA